MATIFSSKRPSGPNPKTHITQGTLPPFIDPKQPPTQKSPWRQINTTPFISSLTLTLPQSLYTTINPHLPQTTSPPIYAKAILTLTQILTPPFFTTHIKKGNVLLLSEGAPGIDTWHATLHSGRLRLDLARATYERCGLQGQPADRNGGARKHTKERWTVDLDLRAPSMVGGKKGFERLLRAAREVLVEGKVWLFRDLDVGTQSGESNELSHATVVAMEPSIRNLNAVLVPTTVSRPRQVSEVPSLEEHEDYLEIVEWLDLVRLGSTRVHANDKTDPYISRYSVPEPGADAVGLKVVTWTGLLDRDWCVRLLVDVVRVLRKTKTEEWVALSVNAYRTEAVGRVDGCVVLLQPGILGEDGGEGEEMDVDAAGVEDMAGRSGLQRFMCFQFVDTVRS